MRRLIQLQDDLLFAIAAVGLAALVLAAVAFSRPVTQTLSEEIPYEQKGEFSYSASAPPALYDFDTIQTTEPAFLRLTDKIHFKFNYRLSTSYPAAVSGTQRLVAEIGDASGWRRTIVLQPETAFTGSSFTSEGDLSLSEVVRLIDYLKEQTGLVRESLTVSILPQVSVEGQIASVAIQDTFNPRLKFAIDSVALQFIPAGPGESDPLMPSKTTLVQRDQQLNNYLSLLSAHLNVSTARTTATAGLVFALLAAGGLVWLRLRPGERDEAARIHARYAVLLVNVEDSARPRSGGITVLTIDDLARVADKAGLMIMHQVRAGEHYYFVQDGKTIYQYRAAGGG
jgi:signal peptidase